MKKSKKITLIIRDEEDYEMYFITRCLLLERRLARDKSYKRALGIFK